MEAAQFPNFSHRWEESANAPHFSSPYFFIISVPCSPSLHLYLPPTGSLLSSPSIHPVIFLQALSSLTVYGRPLLITALVPNATPFYSRCATLKRRTRSLLIVTCCFLPVLSCPAQCDGVQTPHGTGQHLPLFPLAKDLIFLLTVISCALSRLPSSL